MGSDVFPLPPRCRGLRSISFTLLIRSSVSDLLILYSLIHFIIPFLRRWLRFENGTNGVRSQGSFLFGSSLWARTGAAFSTRLPPSASMSTSLAHVLSKTTCRFVGVFVLLLSALSVYAHGKLCGYVEHGVHEAVARAVGGPGVEDMYEGSWGEMCVTVLSPRSETPPFALPSQKTPIPAYHLKYRNRSFKKQRRIHPNPLNRIPTLKAVIQSHSDASLSVQRLTQCRDKAWLFGGVSGGGGMVCRWGG